MHFVVIAASVIGNRIGALKDRQVADLQQQVGLVQQSQRPRVFTAAQEEQLVGALRAAGTCKVITNYLMNDPESMQFAKRITGLFRAAGCEVSEDKGALVSGDVSGMWIEINSNQSIPLAAQVFQVFASTVVGFGFPKLRAQANPQIVAGAFSLTVGHKSD